MFVSNDERFDHYFTIGIPEGMNNALGISGLSRHGISMAPALGQMMAAATDDRLFLQHKLKNNNDFCSPSRFDV
jgi:glycine/D-amino acid oxidase-like deaminating enzyme